MFPKGEFHVIVRLVSNMAVIIILVGGGTAKKDFITIRIQGCSLLGLDLLSFNNIPHFVLLLCFLMSNDNYTLARFIEMT